MSKGSKERGETDGYALVAALVDLLVEVLETPPAVEVVPKVIERLDLLLRIVVGAEHGDGLLLAEAGLALKDGAEGVEEVLFRVPVLRDLGLGRDIGLEEVVVGVDGVELAAALGVCEDLEGFLDALEECVVVGVADSACFLVGVMLEHLFPI